MISSVKQTAVLWSLEEGIQIFPPEGKISALCVAYAILMALSFSIFVLWTLKHYQVPAATCWEAVSACLLFSRLWSIWLWHPDYLSIWFHANGIWCKNFACPRGTMAWSFSFGFWEIWSSATVFAPIDSRGQEKNRDYVTQMLPSKGSAGMEVGARANVAKGSKIRDWSIFCAHPFLLVRAVHTIKDSESWSAPWKQHQELNYSIGKRFFLDSWELKSSIENEMKLKYLIEKGKVHIFRV